MKRTITERKMDKVSGRAEAKHSFCGSQAEEYDYVLTPAGRGACAAAGLAEELLVFLALGLEISATPLLVFLVLWAAFSIITSGLMCWLAGLRGCADAYAYIAEELPMGRAIPTTVCAAEYEYAFAGQKKAS